MARLNKQKYRKLHERRKKKLNKYQNIQITKDD